MKLTLPMHGRNHRPGGSDPIPGIEQLHGHPYGYGVYVDGEPDTLTAPANGDTVTAEFGAELVTDGVDAYLTSGFFLTHGVWHIAAQAHWGFTDIGYEKWMFLQGLVFSAVSGSLDLDLESSDVIPDSSSAYVNRTSVVFRQNEPDASAIVQLAVYQTSGVNKDLASAVLAVVKLRDL